LLSFTTNSIGFADTTPPRIVLEDRSQTLIEVSFFLSSAHCVCVCMYVCVCLIVCIYMYVCMYVYFCYFVEQDGSVD